MWRVFYERTDKGHGNHRQKGEPMRAIDTEGLDEEIRCEMCRNPMHTYKGCDGNCKYDEKLYEKIIQILDKRIKPLPSAQPESDYKTNHGYMWLCPECGLIVHSDFAECVRCGHKREAYIQPEETCDTCKHGYFGDSQCDNCRVGYPSYYERSDNEQNN